MTNLLVSVNHICFPQCLCHVLCKQILLLNCNPDLQFISSSLLLSNPRVLDLAQLVSFLDLVLHFRIHRKFVASWNSVLFRNEARVVLFMLKVSESVLMRWFGAEPSRRGKFDCVCVRPENLVDFSDTLLQCLLLLSIFI